MRIVVFGASGRTGREVVRRALSRGHTVTAFVRQSARLPIVDPHLEVIEGDVANLTAVQGAIAHQDAVVSSLGVGKPLKHDPDVIAGVQHIISGMQAQGVRRLIYQSFIGVTESRSAVGFVLRYIAPLPLRHEIADHEAKEALVKASPTEWTIVRPPKLTDGPASGTYRVGEHISTGKPIPLLSRADVAQFIVQELEHPVFVLKAVRLLP